MNEKVDRTVRCPWAVHYGSMLETRCRKPDDGHTDHEGGGLEIYPWQTVHWLSSDRRCFTTDRVDLHSWEGPYALPERAADGTVRWFDRDGKVVAGPS